MDYSQLNDKLKQALQAKGFELIEEIPVRRCNFVIGHPKFALNGFFKLFRTGRDLIDHWVEVQDEVRENLELHAEILNRHNTYLVFVLPSEELPPIRDVQVIMSDAYICRKLVTGIEDANVQRSLARLPFYPFEIPELPKEAIPKNVTEALAESNLPYELISDLGRRISESTILRKLKESRYKQGEPKSQMPQKGIPSKTYPIYSTRVKKICIIGLHKSHFLIVSIIFENLVFSRKFPEVI